MPPAESLSISQVLDRLDKVEERSSRERGAQAETFNKRLEETADALGQRITDLGTGVDRRIGDILHEQTNARKELRVLMVVMLLIIGGLSGLNLYVGADGSVGVSQPGTTPTQVAPPAEPAMLELAPEPTTAGADGFADDMLGGGPNP